MNLILVLEIAIKYIFGRSVHERRHVKTSMDRSLLKWTRDVKTKSVPRFI